jgi:hypothetical protein
MPVDGDLLEQQRGVREARGLVWAALCSRRDPAARARLARMELSGEERAFLAAGNFTPEQVRIAAALFARRSTHH